MFNGHKCFIFSLYKCFEFEILDSEWKLIGDQVERREAIEGWEENILNIPNASLPPSPIHQPYSIEAFYHKYAFLMLSTENILNIPTHHIILNLMLTQIKFAFLYCWHKSMCWIVYTIRKMLWYFIPYQFFRCRIKRGQNILDIPAEHTLFSENATLTSVPSSHVIIGMFEYWRIVKSETKKDEKQYFCPIWSWEICLECDLEILFCEHLSL